MALSATCDVHQALHACLQSRFQWQRDCEVFHIQRMHDLSIAMHMLVGKYCSASQANCQGHVASQQTRSLLVLPTVLALVRLVGHNNYSNASSCVACLVRNVVCSMRFANWLRLR